MSRNLRGQAVEWPIHMNSEVILYKDRMLGRTQRDRWVRFDCGVGNKEVRMVAMTALTLQGSERVCVCVCACVCVFKWGTYVIRRQRLGARKRRHTPLSDLKCRRECRWKRWNGQELEQKGEEDIQRRAVALRKSLAHRLWASGPTTPGWGGLGNRVRLGAMQSREGMRSCDDGWWGPVGGSGFQWGPSWTGEMVGYHHQLNGHEFKQTLGDLGGRRSLECCSPWGHRESDRI